MKATGAWCRALVLPQEDLAHRLAVCRIRREIPALARGSISPERGDVPKGQRGHSSAIPSSGSRPAPWPR